MESKDYSSAEGLPDAAEFGVLDKLIREIRSRLVEGGPPVEYSAIFGYVDGWLSKEDAAKVERLTHTYRGWHEAYWEVRGLLDLAHEGGSTSTPDRP